MLGDVVVIDHHQAGQKLASIANHHRVGDVWRELQQVLEFRGRDVLATGSDDDVLHPVGDLEIALVVEPTDVTGVQPAVAQRLSRLGRLVIITHEDVGTAQQDLTFRRKPKFSARRWGRWSIARTGARVKLSWY